MDWERGRIRLPSPKTAVHGKASRVVPILPEVRPHLEAVFDAAPEGATHVFAKLRERDSLKAAEQGFWQSLNLRTHLLRLINRAGLKPWPRLWHNLRSSAQTDLADRFPAHVVCDWLGNTKAVAESHYLQVTDDHFQAASQGGAKSGAATACTVSHVHATDVHRTLKNTVISGGCDSMRVDAIGGNRGDAHRFEQMETLATSCVRAYPADRPPQLRFLARLANGDFDE